MCAETSVVKSLRPPDVSLPTAPARASALMRPSDFPYVGAETRVTAVDGRVFVGALRCVDKQRNVVVSNAREYADVASHERGDEPRRTLNLILVAKAQRVACEVDPSSVVPTMTST